MLLRSTARGAPDTFRQTPRSAPAVRGPSLGLHCPTDNSVCHELSEPQSVKLSRTPLGGGSARPTRLAHRSSERVPAARVFALVCASCCRLLSVPVRPGASATDESAESVSQGTHGTVQSPCKSSTVSSTVRHPHPDPHAARPPDWSYAVL